jgi:uncharacterized protein (DUF488 family)
MLNRQKVIVEMLRQAGRAVTKLELVKWAFVLGHETKTQGGPAFYDFVPYHFGPFSFSLAREIQGLVNVGIVRETETGWRLGTEAPKRDPLPAPLATDIRAVVARFKAVPTSNVMDYVYRRYPAFTVNSKRRRLAAKPIAEPQVYTAGYEGLQLDGFLNMLVQSGIQRLIDVRNNPVSRRYGFHKTTLGRLCGYLEIAYEHVPELGIASAERQEAGGEGRSEMFEGYATRTLREQSASVERVVRWVSEKPSVLVCVEADPTDCHRIRLAAVVSQRTGLSVVNLRGPCNEQVQSSEP